MAPLHAVGGLHVQCEMNCEKKKEPVRALSGNQIDAFLSSQNFVDS